MKNHDESYEHIGKEHIPPFSVTHIDNLHLDYYHLRGNYLISHAYCNESEKNIRYLTTAPHFTLEESVPFASLKNINESPSLHQHDSLEIMLILGGFCRHQINDNIYDCPPGYCCILDKWIRHREYLSENSNVIFITLSDYFLKAFIRSTEILTEDPRLLNIVLNLSAILNEYPKTKTYLEFFLRDANRELSVLNRAVDMLTKNLENNTSFNDYLVMNFLAYFFTKLETPRIYQQKTRKLNRASDELLFIQISQKLFQTHGVISRDKLANLLHYSSDHINKTVKKYSGFTLKEYARNFSLSYAAQLLTEKNYSVLETMETLKFTNKTFFYQAFQQKYGMTPKHFKEHYRSLSLNQKT